MGIELLLPSKLWKSCKPPVRGNQARKIVELIQTVEKVLYDLSELGDTGAMKNPGVSKEGMAGLYCW